MDDSGAQRSGRSVAEQAREKFVDITDAHEDAPGAMKIVKGMGITSGMAYTAGFASIFLSLAMWFLRDRTEAGTAERLAIFVGLWPPTFMAIGKALEGYERADR